MGSSLALPLCWGQRAHHIYPSAWAKPLPTPGVQGREGRHVINKPSPRGAWKLHGWAEVGIIWTLRTCGVLVPICLPPLAPSHRLVTTLQTAFPSCTLPLPQSAGWRWLCPV